MAAELLLLSHAGVTLVMVGIMWAVQLAIYPQFRSVPADSFVPYITEHSARIIAVLAPFAPVEIILALLVWVVRPDGTSGWVAFLAGLVLAAAWIATGLFYAPIHGRLQRLGHDQHLIERLIVTNWFRTGLWTMRGVLALVML